MTGANVGVNYECDQCVHGATRTVSRFPQKSLEEIDG